jgi:hypothetical protein
MSISFNPSWVIIEQTCTVYMWRRQSDAQVSTLRQSNFRSTDHELYFASRSRQPKNTCLLRLWGTIGWQHRPKGNVINASMLLDNDFLRDYIQWKTVEFFATTKRIVHQKLTVALARDNLAKLVFLYLRRTIHVLTTHRVQLHWIAQLDSEIPRSPIATHANGKKSCDLQPVDGDTKSER